MARFTYGGQALIEGVLMRGRDAIAVAFRHPDGRIVWASEPLNSGPHGWRLAKAPLVRGLIVLYETLVVGTRWLIRSANIQASEDGVELGRGSVAIMLAITAVAGIGVFFLIPLFVASATTATIADAWVQHLVENAARLLLFIGYLVLISRAPGIRRRSTDRRRRRRACFRWRTAYRSESSKTRAMPKCVSCWHMEMCWCSSPTA